MGGATDVLAELLLHGVVATLVVEALLHWVPVEAPAARFPYRVTALAVPVVLAVVFARYAPFRREDWFQDASVFVSSRWQLLRFGPLDVRTWGLLLSGVAGGVLLARDLLHAAHDAWHVRQQEANEPRLEVPAAVHHTVSSLAAELGIRPPGLDLLVAPDHALHCRGSWRPRIVMSTGTLDAVTDEELRTALAHELAHISHRDVSRNWFLLGLRAIQWFNPFAQAVGRRTAQELEWRADDRASTLTDAPLALAHALVRCARRRGDQFLGLSGRGRLRMLEERCRRLMRRPEPPDAPWRLDLVLLWAGLATLLVFVQ